VRVAYDLFSNLTIADVHQDVIRNVVSLREPQDLFDDLTDISDNWRLAQQVANSVKPLPLHSSTTPVIHRPFEDSQWLNAIAWPFKSWQASRFSDGSFGVWYGCDSAKATVYETAYHWYRRLLSDAGFEREPVVCERKLYAVKCDAALLDFRQSGANYPNLLHTTDYTQTQSVGARIHQEGHPGLLTSSVRYSEGEIYAVFNPMFCPAPDSIAN